MERFTRQSMVLCKDDIESALTPGQIENLPPEILGLSSAILRRRLPEPSPAAQGPARSTASTYADTMSIKTAATRSAFSAPSYLISRSFLTCDHCFAGNSLATYSDLVSVTAHTRA